MQSFQENTAVYQQKETVFAAQQNFLQMVSTPFRRGNSPIIFSSVAYLPVQYIFTLFHKR